MQERDHKRKKGAFGEKLLTEKEDKHCGTR